MAGKNNRDLALLVDLLGPVPKRRVSRIMKKNGETKRTAGDAQTDPALPHKTIALIEIALNAASTGLQSDDTCSSIRAALEAGATREEILIVLKMASAMSIGGRSLRAAILDRCKGNHCAHVVSSHENRRHNVHFVTALNRPTPGSFGRGR